MLARAIGAGGGGSAGHRPVLQALRDRAWSTIVVQTLRMVARLPTPVPSSFGFFRSSSLARKIDALLADRDVRPDLRALLVGGAVRVVARGHAEDPRFRRHGFAEVARIRAVQAVSAERGLLAGGPQARQPRNDALRGSSICAPRRRAPSGRRSMAIVRGTPTDWFPNGVDSDYFAPGGETYEPTRSRSWVAWTTTRTRNACSTSARRRWPHDPRARGPPPDC